MILKQHEHCKFDFNQSNSCLTQTWTGLSSSEQFREAILDTLDFFKKTQDAKSIISDTREQNLVKLSDTNWVIEEINPQLIQNGLRKMAFVLPKDIIAELSVDRFIKISDKFEMGHFEDLKSAKEWISS